MGIKDFFNKIISGSKEVNSSINKKENKHQVKREIETLSDGSKKIKLKHESGKEISINIRVGSGKTSSEDYYERERTYIGKTEYGSHEYEYIDANGEKRTFITSQSPKEYNRRKKLDEIKEKVSKLSIKYKGIEYDDDKLTKMSYEISEREKIKKNEVPDILITQELSDEVKKDFNYWKTKNAASGWKSRQRSLRKKGKLEQHKIDALNKLGMLWNPKEDEWEKKYIRFRTYGLCNEIESWVKQQRKLYENGELSNENLLRLQAANFPFTPLPNETFKFTSKSLWELRAKLDRKKRRFELDELKSNRLVSSKRKEKKKKKLTKREKEQKQKQSEVNSFYNRKFHFCNMDNVHKLNNEYAKQKLADIDSGKSFKTYRLKEFLDIESDKFKTEGKRVPQYVKGFYSEGVSRNIDSDEIYDELSYFIKPKVNSEIRLIASQLMLKHISTRNLNNSNSFKEINYLIGEYKKQKNTTELKFLLDFINKYPLLKELYLDKINKAMSKI